MVRSDPNKPLRSSQTAKIKKYIVDSAVNTEVVIAVTFPDGGAWRSP
jgi:hypothetical protein